MKITLINVSGRLSSDGSRLISALLKRANHDVKSVFLARPEPLDYGQVELQPLDEILKNMDLVMIAVYSSYAIRAVQVTEYIRQRYPGMKIIWGGPHCVSAPELGLHYADAVCFSEGDEVVVDLIGKLASGNDYLDTSNMAFRGDKGYIVNDPLPPFADLDSLPYYDYDLEDQFLLDRGLFQMNEKRLQQRLASYPYNIPILYLLTSRGCPHRCSYCNNCRYTAMFGRNSMRFQSFDRVLEELESTLRRFDFYRLVGFGDDDFFARPVAELADFAQKYRTRVGLPFGIAISARTYQKKKIEALLDSGLKIVQMGVQSASQRVLSDVYHRKIKISKTTNAIHQIETYHKTHGLNLLLDFIIDNPYETRDDIALTYQYLLDLPPHVRVNMFFLAFFPGTPIYDRAVRDGIIQPFSERTFRFYTRSQVRYQKNYETFLILLIRYLRRRKLLKYIPRSLLHALGSRPVRWIAAMCPQSVYAALSKIIQ